MLFSIGVGAIIGIVIGVLVLILVIALVSWGIKTHNNIIKLRNNVEESFSTMDVYLKKRWDLIPNLVETVKGYANHENKTLEAVISARNMAVGAKNAQEKISAENALTGTLKSLFAVSESYPNLKADAQFLRLQNQLNELENEIAQSRKYYNAKVKAFNTMLEIFPSSIIAGFMKQEKKTFFEISDEAHRENVKISF